MISQQRDKEGLLCISFLHHWWQDFHWGIKYLPCLGTPVLWPPHVKSWLIGKDSDAGRDWGQDEKGKTEDEMAGWHHWLDGHESEWTLGVGDGQGGLACCNSWGHKESDTTERLNWTELMFRFAHASKWLSGFLQVPNSESVSMSGIETSSSA